MAKSDSFFIRAQVTSNATYTQAEVDLGSFVNLGVSKSTLLRVHNIQASYTDTSDPSAVIYYDGAQPGSLITWQLTTQTQSAIITSYDKSVVARGTRYQTVVPAGFSGGVIAAGPVDEIQDVNPTMFSKGYLIGTDSVFLGADASQTMDSGDYDISLIMECTLENATQANSVALALSQQ
jgi:hypothetical protein